MLEVILGGRGHGKSAYATWRALYDHQIRGKKIYSNFWINIPHALPNLNNPKEDIQNASVIFDEAYISVNARLSMSKANRLINYFVFQSRKVDVDLYFVVQLGRTIDVLIRDSADKLTMCKALYRGADGILRVKDTDTDAIDATAVITFDQNNDRFHTAIFDPKPFYAFFDSKERISRQAPEAPAPKWTTRKERNKLIENLVRAGKTQTQIAKELGLSQTQISRIIRHKNA